MNPVSGYSIGAYGAMVADRVRMDAYAAALKRVVTNDSVVLDIGAGTGILSLLACQYGARHVYAVEPDDSIQVAKNLAKANGYADRITFLQDISTRVQLPERAHVIVSDLRGTLPFFEQHIPSVVDARTRHLALGGVLIPEQDTVWACPVETPETWQKRLAPWGNDVLGVDLSSNRNAAVNCFHSDTVKTESLLARPLVLANLDYRRIVDPNLDANLKWKVDRDGMLHGISVWFEARLAGTIGFSTAPGQPLLVYGMGLLLVAEPVEISADDIIDLEIKGNLVGGKYLWQWKTRVTEGGVPNRIKADFKQTTFETSAVSLEKLRKRGSDFVPHCNEDARFNRFVLNLMDGKATLREISQLASAEFPERYHDWQEALADVGEISMKYSR